METFSFNGKVKICGDTAEIIYTEGILEEEADFISKPSLKADLRSLSDLGNRSENLAGRGQILSILQGNSCSIDQESGEIWTVQTDLQQIYPKSDRLLAKGERNAG